MTKPIRELFPDEFRRSQNNINTSFCINKEVMGKFRKYCDNHGFKMSKRIEILMERELENTEFKE